MNDSTMLLKSFRDRLLIACKNYFNWRSPLHGEFMLVTALQTAVKNNETVHFEILAMEAEIFDVFLSTEFCNKAKYQALKYEVSQRCSNVKIVYIIIIFRKIRKQESTHAQAVKPYCTSVT